MTAPALSPLAVSAAPLLRALARGGHATLSDLAAACGRDVRHLNRDIARLCAEALAAVPPGAATKDAALTDAGFAALAALARAEGPDAPDGVWLAAHQLLPDQAQPRQRTGLDDDAIDQLAASILERHAQGLPGLITPPTVRWVGDDDHPGLVEWVIVSGERRWRAWTAALRLRTALIDPLPADTRFFCPIFRGTPAQAAVHAAVENLQRSDLDDLEWADHFAAMVDADPSLNGARIAALLGRAGPSGERWVQERLRVARMATPQARARFVESRRRAVTGEPDPEPFTWTHLRDSVKVAAPKARPIPPRDDATDGQAIAAPRCGGSPEPRSDDDAEPGPPVPALLDEDGAVLAAGPATRATAVVSLDDAAQDDGGGAPAETSPAPSTPLPSLRQATIALHRAAAAQAELVAGWLGSDPPTYSAMHAAHAALVRALDDLRPYLPAPPGRD